MAFDRLRSFMSAVFKDIADGKAPMPGVNFAADSAAPQPIAPRQPQPTMADLEQARARNEEQRGQAWGDASALGSPAAKAADLTYSRTAIPVVRPEMVRKFV